jgi:hypothetical protein
MSMIEEYTQRSQTPASEQLDLAMLNFFQHLRMSGAGFARGTLARPSGGPYRVCTASPWAGTTLASKCTRANGSRNAWRSVWALAMRLPSST